MAKLTKAQEIERDEAIARVKEWLENSQRDRNGKMQCFTSLRSVAKSGMSRVIACFIPVVDDEANVRMVDATWSIAKILRDPIRSTPCGEGIYTTGCGMDMGFHIVYNLGLYIWPNGTPKPHGTRNGAPDNNGGYAISQSWL